MFWNGNYAVIGFFVISGYLITSTSLRRFGSLRLVSLRQFYSYRFARIYPCLLLVLAVVTIPGLAGVRYFASNKPVSFLMADFSILTFWHNILMSRAGYFNYCLNILWSLSVEEVFYVVFPLLCLLLKRDLLILSIWVAAIVYAPMYRIQHASDDIEYLYANFSCFDAIAMGCCTALLSGRFTIPGRYRNVVQVLAVTSMVAVFFCSSIGKNVLWGPTLMAASTALFLWAESGATSGKQTPNEPIGWLRRHSYELYLFHIVVLAAMRNVLDRKQLPAMAKWPWFILFVALSALLAWIIARWYSEPLNRHLRRKLNQSATVIVGR